MNNIREVDLDKFPDFCGNCIHFSMEETGEWSVLKFFCSHGYKQTLSVFIDAEEIDNPFSICDNHEKQDHLNS